MRVLLDCTDAGVAECHPCPATTSWPGECQDPYEEVVLRQGGGRAELSLGRR